VADRVAAVTADAEAVTEEREFPTCARIGPSATTVSFTKSFGRANGFVVLAGLLARDSMASVYLPGFNSGPTNVCSGGMPRKL
jgi:hypothetical protein